MITIRRSADRGHFDHGWLDTYHTFSFGSYYDPAHMGFRSLRVMNEDVVKPGEGFGTHPHRNMEIVTYILEGALEHKDSMGNGEILRAGELQRMSAGTGITHSEFNPSPTERVHLYQIWLLPERNGIEPSYEQRGFPEEDRRGRLQLVAAPDGAGGALRIHQDARLYLATIASGDELNHPVVADRHAWVQVLQGSAVIGGEELGDGDGAAISDERHVSIGATTGAEIMLFDLA